MHGLRQRRRAASYGHFPPIFVTLPLGAIGKSCHSASQPSVARGDRVTQYQTILNRQRRQQEHDDQCCFDEDDGGEQWKAKPVYFYYRGTFEFDEFCIINIISYADMRLVKPYYFPYRMNIKGYMESMPLLKLLTTHFHRRTETYYVS